MGTQAHSEIIPATPPEIVAALIQRPTAPKPAAKPKKKLVRRTDRDYSQILRRSFQGACGNIGELSCHSFLLVGNAHKIPLP